VVEKLLAAQASDSAEENEAGIKRDAGIKRGATLALDIMEHQKAAGKEKAKMH